MKKQNETTKDRILDSAEALFSDKGFDGTKVQEIAAGAGVNKAMLYYYFKDKDDLLIAVIGRIIEGIREAIPRYFDGEDSAVDNIEKFIDFYIGYLSDNTAFVRLMAWEMLSARHVETLAREHILPVFSLMREKITDAVSNGWIRKVSPEHTLISFVGMNIFYVIASPLFMLILGENPLSDEMIAKRKQAVKDLIMHGLIPRTDEQRS